ncbi:permease [Candidatus Desantisbacteria bacterium CG_4_10_14_0_8_um_filter_48_22]|uniref:Permease n=1 Tax=Candidatus Desantisbacteria bacterium CG_4_10_14_0_8_um_filter_48_22 TaxID=1974543 RepID=A0A2M7S5C1_9BACT|nr:MAG: permease [Candidatus Desantisbacteria bacterium CG1_02_49_89]PIV57322.1 MAG: permease [Candidatus Desantisbacteria bacterium CG02_land_8_20_14_3_00_49_13]PIZ14629.1 MAG: permease [Candidatus Desantisbacteria bacterium CG_4_10_14_0_8_um_filter_48_22]
MFSFVISLIAIIFLIVSAVSSREKTLLALKTAGKTAAGILPFLLIIIVIIGFLLTFVPPHVIASLIGRRAGFWGVLIASIIGSILLVPHFVAAPLAASLLHQGAGIPAIAAFVTTLVMVGIVTMPMEMEVMGRKFTIWRNLLSFGFALLIALIMGALL